MELWTARLRLFQPRVRGVSLQLLSQPRLGLGAQWDPLGSLTVCLSLQPVGQTSGGEYDPRKQHAPAQGNVGAVAVSVLLSRTPNSSGIKRWRGDQGGLEPR